MAIDRSGRRRPSSAFGPLRTHAVVDPADLSHGAGGRKKRRKRKGRDGPEAREQKKFVAWARKRGLELQHQNNGAGTKAARIRLHAMGCTAGAADILIFDVLPDEPGVRGLALEFKSEDGEQTPDQVKWQRRIERLGWRYHVVRSKDQATEVVQWYGLGLTIGP